MPHSRLLTFLLTPLLGACCCAGFFQTPGSLQVAITPAATRTDTVLSRQFRGEDRLAKAVNKVIIVTPNQGSSSEGFVKIVADGSAKDVEFEHATTIGQQQSNAYIGSVERALMREGLTVLDREEFARMAREKSLDKEEETAKLLGADAILKINKMEFIVTPRTQDVETLAVFRQSLNPDQQPTHIKKILLADFFCHIDGKLILTDGTVAWVGETFFPASQLINPETSVIVFDLIDKTEAGPHLMAPQIRPRLEYVWKDSVEADSTWKLPEGLVVNNENLRSIAIRYAARDFVERIFSVN